MPYTHLTENERYVISHLSIARFTPREIARRINRHHTTVSRELERNGPEYDCTIYWYDWTHSSLSMVKYGGRCLFHKFTPAGQVHHTESSLSSPIVKRLFA